MKFHLTAETRSRGDHAEKNDSGNFARSAYFFSGSALGIRQPPARATFPPAPVPGPSPRPQAPAPSAPWPPPLAPPPSAACRAIPTLDLKFVVHHGAYIAQRVAGTTELVGADVALAHRLLKNGVAEATGWRLALPSCRRSVASPASWPIAAAKPAASQM